MVKDECIQDFGGKARRRRPLGRPRCRLKDNINMDLKRDEMGWYGMD
jgi:hypothetical protein